MYRSVQFSVSGNKWVFDHEQKKSVSDVWECLSDQGSKWIFYPVPFVIRGEHGNTNFKTRRIVSACDGLQFLEGKTIETARRFIKYNQEYIRRMLS